VSLDSYPAHGVDLQDINLDKVQKFTNKVNAAVGKFKDAQADRLGKSCYHRGPFFIRESYIGYNVHVGRLKTPSFIIDDRNV